MVVCSSRLGPALVTLAAGLILALMPIQAAAVQLTCSVVGDGMGWSIATGHDFDGDGIEDLAASGPCAYLRGERLAGRVLVYSGADGSKLLKVKGSMENQRLGSSVSFIDDVSGDGLPDLVVGSYGWNVDDITSSGATISCTKDSNCSQGGCESGICQVSKAGKVEVIDGSGDVVVSRLGQDKTGHLGETVVGLADLNADSVPDFLAGAGGDDDSTGKAVGATYLLSGADGSVIDQSYGTYTADYWGSVLAAMPDVNNDGFGEILIASGPADSWAWCLNTSTEILTDTVLPCPDAGVAKVVSGADMGVVFGTVNGDNMDDKLGKAVAPLAVVDSNGTAGFVAGIPAAGVDPMTKAGAVRIYYWNGNYIREIIETTPTKNAKFGKALAAVGDVDSDGITDFAAGAPNAKVDDIPDAGRVTLISTADGSVLWTAEGSIPDMNLGASLALTRDWDGDGLRDIAAGAPGDNPRGRLGAGSVRILSAADGSLIQRFAGRRGVETRIFTAGRDRGGRASIRTFGYGGRRKALRYRPDRTSRDGRLSIGLLGNVLSEDPTPGSTILVVGKGPGSTDPTVEFRYAGRRNRRVRSYSITTTANFTAGVNVAAGNLDAATGLEIVAVDANSAEGSVGGVVYKQDVDPSTLVTSWSLANTFVAFDANEVPPLFTGAGDPGGGNVAVGRVKSGDYQEIVVGSLQGPALVRAFDSDGIALEDGLLAAYPADQYSGVNVALGDLGGDTKHWVLVTGPVSGPARVRAWQYTASNGFQGFDLDSETDGVQQLDFMAFSSCVGGSAEGACCIADADCSGGGSCLGDDDYDAGVEVAVADVDADGKNEILAAPSGQSDETRILAYEADGTCVESWTVLRPFGPGAGYGVSLAATSRFFRRGAGARATTSSAKRKGRKHR